MGTDFTALNGSEMKLKKLSKETPFKSVRLCIYIFAQSE